MGSDRARVSYDAQRQYRAVIMQQGRVTVEADWNEEWQIVNEEMRKEVLDIVGSCGTPDDGYDVVAAEQSSPPLSPLTSPPADPYDFSVTRGTMYVGGLRAYLPQDILYSQQGEWIDHPSLSSPPGFSPPSITRIVRFRREFIYLWLREQEVSAVEDTVLREVALGGPDTAQRLRLIQRIMRFPTEAEDCDTALAEAVKRWATLGYTFVAHDGKSNDMRLLPSGKLQAIYPSLPTQPDPCEPQATGGFLGADNQLIRVQISLADAANNNYRLLWGYDNASFLYRVSVVDGNTLKLASQPIDDFHQPRQGQTVEVLRSAVQLDTATPPDYIASATGAVTTLQSDYDTGTGYVSLKDGLSAPYLDPNQTPVLFLRVWEEEKPFTLGTPVDLGDAALGDVTGLQVTIQVDEGEVLGVGAYWLMAVRPNTPTEVYPHRYLESPQPPDGPRIWVCPLAVIEWDGPYNFYRLADCRNQFDNLVDLSRIKQGGCCTLSVRPEDVTPNNTLQHMIDRYKNMDKITICLMPGQYNLTEPLRFGAEHSNLTLEGCHEGAVLQVATNSEANFLDGMIVMNRADNVTIQGLSFVLPLVPFNPPRSTNTLAGLDSATMRRLLSTQLRGLQISIGIRPLHCANLTIKDCNFQFLSTSTIDQSVFGAGIFAGSLCQGLTIQGNQFERQETPLLLSESPFGVLFGYVLAPTTTFASGKSSNLLTTAGTSTPGGTFVLSQLQDASFQHNLFTGLSAAALIYADVGTMKIERNIVRNCYIGFWLFSLRSFASASLIDSVSVSTTNLAAAQPIYKWIAETMLDPIIQIGSVIARGYPLPAGLNISEAIQIASGEISRTTVDAATARMQLLFDQAVSPTATETSSVAQEKHVKLSAEKTITLASSIFTSGTGLGRFNALHLLLATFERTALAQQAAQRLLHLALQVTDNDIDALIINTTTALTDVTLSTSTALVVWDDGQDTESMLTMSANKLRNLSTSMLTALVLMVDRCAITGNLIFNEEQQVPTGRQNYLSLGLVAGLRDKIPAVAVTGNVFQRTPYLPPRPTVPAPLNTWEVLNTVV